MAIHRHPPGTPAPYAGVYALVGHYGEPTGIAIECAQGARLPLGTVADVPGPFWFIRVAEATGEQAA